MDRQYVGIDFHRRRSVIVRLSADGERLGFPRYGLAVMGGILVIAACVIGSPMMLVLSAVALVLGLLSWNARRIAGLILRCPPSAPDAQVSRRNNCRSVLT